MISVPLRIVGKGVTYIALTAAGVVVEKYASKKFEDFQHYANEHGGYKKVANNALRAADIEARRVVFHAEKSLDEMLQPVFKTVRTEGRKISEGASEVLGDLKDAFNETYYTYYPRPEELAESGKYEGIGSARRNTFLTRLSRDDCENCLGFIERAKERIPENQPLKQTVITDIRRSGSYDAKVLEKFYQDIFSWQYSDTIKLRVLMDCVQLAEDFLKEPAVSLVGEKYNDREE